MGGLHPPAVRHVPILVEAEARPGLEEAGRGSLVRPSTEHRGGRGGQKVVTSLSRHQARRGLGAGAVAGVSVITQCPEFSIISIRASYMKPL